MLFSLARIRARQKGFSGSKTSLFAIPNKRNINNNKRNKKIDLKAQKAAHKKKKKKKKSA
jgi:hypothetical protein